MIEADDATDYQCLMSRFSVASVRKAAGNTVSAMSAVDSAVSLSAGTLTCAFTITEGAGACTINATAVSSLTQTTLNISFLAETVGSVTIAKL